MNRHYALEAPLYCRTMPHSIKIEFIQVQFEVMIQDRHQSPAFSSLYHDKTDIDLFYFRKNFSDSLSIYQNYSHIIYCTRT